MLRISCVLLISLKLSRGLPSENGFQSSIPSTGYEDFVGFSYSRALLPPTSSFIHFLHENTNINADFVPKYSSFRVTTPGIYGFEFSFSSMPESGLTEVVLLKDSIPILSAVSDKFGVSRFIMLPLVVGNVIQLQVINGFLSEDGKTTSTTFSGWLLSKPTRTTASSRTTPDCNCCSYSRTTPRPLNQYRPPMSRSPSCCNRLILSSGSDKAVQNYQSEKLGFYNLLYVDANGRHVYKHAEHERVYLYYFSRPRTSWRGWMIGPSPGGVMGGILSENDGQCPSDAASWHYYHTSGQFHPSPELSLRCKDKNDNDEGVILDIGRKIGRSKQDGHFSHSHSHVHYHHHRHDNDESTWNGNVMLPFYSVKADPNIVTATFVYANNGSLDVYPSTKGTPEQKHFLD